MTISSSAGSADGTVRSSPCVSVTTDAPPGGSAGSLRVPLPSWKPRQRSVVRYRTYRHQRALIASSAIAPAASSQSKWWLTRVCRSVVALPSSNSWASMHRFMQRSTDSEYATWTAASAAISSLPSTNAAMLGGTTIDAHAFGMRSSFWRRRASSAIVPAASRQSKWWLARVFRHRST